MPTPVAILLSGRGSNFLALHAAIERRKLPAEIVLVLSNAPGTPGLEKARERGLEAVCIPHRAESSHEAHDRKVVAALTAAGAEWVCLAGYMRLLTSTFVRAFPERILNIHPSLLPAFPGLQAQRQALDYGVAITGCTVHLVDEELDHGPIVVQRVVPVEPDDTQEALSARILAQEHRAYPLALRRLLTESWSVDGRRVRF
ncbi:MAG: phosphoribosylglycinamide formyltransferase [Acidobacteria bacterium]|nr:phosphoribosylglycinamide formyltransferase [Acidobacteriota bacterium]